MIDAQVGVAAALAVAVDRALHVPRAGAHRGQACWRRAQPPSSWAWMPSRDSGRARGDRAHRLARRPRAGCRRWCRTAPRPRRRRARPRAASRARRPASARVAVEEVLGVVDHPPARGRAGTPRSPRSCVRFSSRRGAQHLASRAASSSCRRSCRPAVPASTSARRFGSSSGAELGAAGRAERGDAARACQLDVARAREELGVLGVRAGPAALDVGRRPNSSSRCGDAQLVLER